MDHDALDRPVSLAVQLRQILMERLKSGQYPPESRLPPENELAAQFNVSRATVRSAIEMLAAQGLVVRKQGVGTFVSRRSGLANPLNRAMDFHELIANNGFEPGHDFVDAALVTPPVEVSRALDVDAQQPALRTHKIFTADGEPVIYSINHVPLWVMGEETAQAALADPWITEPLYDFLELRCGHRVEYHVCTLAAAVGRDCRFPGLELDPCLPVLVMEEVGQNGDERPVWHSTVYYPGNRMTFELIRQRDPALRSHLTQKGV